MARRACVSLHIAWPDSASTFHDPLREFVGTDHDLSVAFGGILHEFDGYISTTVRVKGVDDRPPFVRSVV